MKTRAKNTKIEIGALKSEHARIVRSVSRRISLEKHAPKRRKLTPKKSTIMTAEPIIILGERKKNEEETPGHLRNTPRTRSPSPLIKKKKTVNLEKQTKSIQKIVNSGRRISLSPISNSRRTLQGGSGQPGVVQSLLEAHEKHTSEIVAKIGVVFKQISDVFVRFGAAAEANDGGLGLSTEDSTRLNDLKM